MHRQNGQPSPHKACLLLAVMDLVEREVITENRIYYNDALKAAFANRFEPLRGDRGLNRPYVPYYYLKSSNFWHHQQKDGATAAANYLAFEQNGNTEARIRESVRYVYLDPPLFEYFRSANARSALKAALAENFNDEQIRELFLNPAAGWSWQACEAAVDEYFELLQLELMGGQYDKAEPYHKLKDKVLQHAENHDQHSAESIYQNISAVLVEAGVPVIDGLAPAPGYQANILPDVIGAQIAAKQNQLERVIEEVVYRQHYEIPSVEQICSQLGVVAEQEHPYQVQPPAARSVREPAAAGPQTKRYKPREVNYLKREMRNKVLGESGEKFVVNYEKARLIHSGKEALADRVAQVSTGGTGLGDDSLGYDIHSYEQNGKDRFIEVKTTNFTKHARFYVTRNEVEVSENLHTKYHLYRVFNFKQDPRFFQARGKLKANFILEPTTYQASIRG